MKYDLYFHDDFDGRACAAVFLDFFRRQQPNNSIARFIPVSYPVPQEWSRDDFFSQPNILGGDGNPAIVVDFRYHPSASFWIDHHATPFLTPDWQRRYLPSLYHCWDSSYLSCCRQVIVFLSQSFGYQPPSHIVALGHWLDIVDGAAYQSVEQAVFRVEPAFLIDAFIDERSRHGDQLIWLIEMLSTHTLDSIVEDQRLVSYRHLFSLQVADALAFYRAQMIFLKDSIGCIDLSSSENLIKEIRFAPYLIAPEMLVVISIKPRPQGGFHVNVGVNPWKRDRFHAVYPDVHIGSLMQSVGGGGHQYVGGAETNTHVDAERIVQSVVDRMYSRQ
ncbi:MAG: hypothetical protein RIQ54_482 [Candidatus Parcubacteria bacterium]